MAEISNLEHDEDRRIIATLTPSLICQVKESCRKRLFIFAHLSSFEMKQILPFSLLFVILGGYIKDTVLWREVALPHGSLAYPLHLSSNRHFILKMIPCVSPACTDPIPGAKYHVVPFLRNDSSLKIKSKVLNYQSSNDHKSEKMGLHIGCRVHFDEEAEDYLAATDPVPDKGVKP